MEVTQNDRILGYMVMFGSISPIEAMQELGCMRLAARISDLKRKGYNIKSKMETAKNRFGENIKYSRYFIEADKGEELNK